MKKQYHLIVLICLCIAGVTSTTFADSNSQAAATLLDRIVLGEGTSDAAAQEHGLASDYDITYAYGQYNPPDSKPLSEMTIGEVKQLQQQMIANQAGNKLKSSAVGKYQLIAETLEVQQKILGLPDDTKFDAATQELFGLSLLEKRGFSKWIDGTITDHDFQKNLAKEWASVADPDTGKSYYGQNVGTTDAQIKEAMAQTKTAALAGTSGAEHRPLLLEQIALGEGTDNATAKGHQFDSGYDVPFAYGKYGRPSTPLTKMTIREVMDFQAQMIAAQIKAGIDPKDASGAVGKYQITQTNLLDLMNRFNPGISLDTKFNVLTQDMLAISILDKSGYNEWLERKKSDHDFQKNLAKEWASVADPDTGKSYYGGQNIGTTDAQIKEAMAQSKSGWTSYICGCYAKLGRVCPY